MKYMSRSITEELEDVPQESIGPYFEQIGKIISWIGSGNDASLPDGLREFLAARMGTEIAAEDNEVVPVLESYTELDQQAAELELEAQGY
jgi:hypothetical protein